MQVPPPSTLEFGSPEFETALEAVPNSDAVFIFWAGDRSAYLARTTMLRRRLLRIVKPASAGGETPRRGLNLRGVASRVDYWLTGSRFESMLVHYALARQHFPDDYLRMVKLRMPVWVKLVLSNEFPRTQLSTRLGVGRALYYGPFPSRGAAEQFETQMLELFQLRRCQENLEPHPGHPGCIYGEMNMCLRPCQQAVSVEEYASEASRVAEFLNGNGSALAANTLAARERLSQELNFEEAARQHKQLERIQAVLAARGELACDLEKLYGIAVTPSLDPGAVRLWFSCRGSWQMPVEFPLTSYTSLEHRLHEIVGALAPVDAPLPECQEHVALLARWRFSSWSDGEWVGFPGLAAVPYRKLVRAISRVRAALPTV
ncbi:MAG: hypothetical protein M3O35_13085 [Acidobacteriota bacterium]|nr:hypothetical protein [Acidobacteriota bacterium]